MRRAQKAKQTKRFTNWLASSGLIGWLHPDAMLAKLLLLDAVLVIAQPYNVSAFVAGAICEGVDAGTSASRMLRGRHLKLFEAEWAPFASVDPSAPSGWRGTSARD